MYPQTLESVKQCLPNGHKGFLPDLDLVLLSTKYHHPPDFFDDHAWSDFMMISLGD